MNQDKSPNWNLYGDDESEDSGTSSIKKRQPDFFGAFMANRLAQTEKSEPGSEEDTTEDGKKVRRKKKFTGLLNEIFPQIVEPEKSVPKTETPEPPSASSQENSQHNVVPNKTSSLSPDERYPESASAVANDSPERADIPNDTLPESMSSTEEVDTESSPATESEPVTISDTSEEAKADVVVPNYENESVNLNQDQYYDVAHTTNPTPAERASRRTTSEADNFVLASETPPIPQSHTETIIENKPVGAILAFLGAEFLSRRRDRKIRATINKQKKSNQADIRGLKENQLSQAQAQERLREHQIKQGEELAAIQKNSVGTQWHRPNSPVNNPGKKYDQHPQPFPGTSEVPADASIVRGGNHRSTLEKATLPLVVGEFQRNRTRDASGNAGTERSADPREATEKMFNFDERSAESLSHIIKKRQYQNRARTYEGFASIQNNESGLSSPESGAPYIPGAGQSSQSQNNGIGPINYKQPVQVGVASALVIIIAFIIVYISIY